MDFIHSMKSSIFDHTFLSVLCLLSYNENKLKIFLLNKKHSYFSKLKKKYIYNEVFFISKRWAINNSW